MAGAATATLATALTLGLAEAAASLATASVIASRRDWWNPWLAWLGKISYSLYLVHWPVGMTVLSLVLKRFADPFGAIVGATIGLALSVLAAWLLHVTVEQPSMRWAARVRYGRARQASRTTTPLPDGDHR